MNRTRNRRSATPSRQGGAVIIVVVSLLTTLVFLGLFFFNWTSQERTNAEFFANSDPLEIDPDPIFDFGLRQVIVSTPSTAPSSPLITSNDGNSRWSLLASQLGPITADGAATDLTPNNGPGIRVNATSPTNYSLDYDGDGNADLSNDFVINFSLASSSNGDPIRPTRLQFTTSGDNFRLDAGYTYPDLNSLFLAVDEDRPDGSGNLVRVVKPSFLPVGYYDSSALSGSNFYAAGSGDQYMRPHVEHRSAAAGSPRRFVSTLTGIQSAKTGDQTRTIAPFDFTSPEFGPFTGSATSPSFDVDTDGDGIKESILMDLDHPIIDVGGGRQVSPIFAFKIVDGDGLLNLNTHGNLALTRFLNQYFPAIPLDPQTLIHDFNDWLSQSNMGLTPSEVNVGAALYADPQDTTGKYVDTTNLTHMLMQHRGYFQNSSLTFNRLQMANTEWHFLATGRPQFADSTGTLVGTSSDDLPGRCGEPALIRPARVPTTNSPFPAEGQTLFDDDHDGNSNLPAPPITTANPLPDLSGIYGGRSYYDHVLRYGNGTLITQPAFRHPLDFSGLGKSVYKDTQGFEFGPGYGALRIRNGVAPNQTGYTWPITLLYPALYADHQDVLSSPSDNDLKYSNPTYWPWYPHTFINQLSVITGSPAPYHNFWQPQLSISNGIAGYLGAGISNPMTVPPYALQPSPLTSTAYSLFDGLVDEPDELALGPTGRNNVDAIFYTSEIAGLQLSDSDWQACGLQSRIRNLAPFNMELNRQASAIRSQFTTESWNRREFALSYTADTRGNHEFSDTLNSLPRFPPSYTSSVLASPQHHEARDVTALNDDPFRPVLRRLLATYITRNSSSTTLPRAPQHRLNINRLLVNFDENGNPLYRNLMPHAQFLDTDSSVTVPDMVHTSPAYADSEFNTSLYTTAPTTAMDLLDPAPQGAPLLSTVNPGTLAGRQAQEWWARYDRQRMARDIFMILYTVGGMTNSYNLASDAEGNDANGIPTSSGNGCNDMVDQMAQFAVNCVDALDGDDTITRFEYDINPMNGWGNSGEIRVVNGVELQSLTLSEAMWIVTLGQGSGNDRTDITAFNDEDEHQWLFLELRNASPFHVDMNLGDWRLVREDGGAVTASVEISDPADAGISAGNNFLISCQDSSMKGEGANASLTRASDFYVDIASSTGLELIVPNDTHTQRYMNGASDFPAPLCDLDLTWSGHSSYIRNVARYSNAPDHPTCILVSPHGGAAETVASFDIVLQRRRSMGTNGIGQNSTTDWIEVDRMTVDRRSPNFTNDTASSALDVLTATTNKVVSNERYQPLCSQKSDHVIFTKSAFAALDQQSALLKLEGRNHSMNIGAPSTPNRKHAANDNWLGTEPDSTNGSFSPYPIWQPHFDRDFSSIFELLSVPRFSPQQLVNLLGSESDTLAAVANTVAKSSLRPNTTASRLFLDQAFGINLDTSNNWYRLFEFIEVPTRSQHVNRDEMNLIRRSPGHLNLNTIRHEHVLAALVDDDYHINASSTTVRPTQDLIDATTRNWYDRLLAERDGAMGSTFPSLPGLPTAAPFRPLSYIDPTTATNSVQHTILRRMTHGTSSPLSQIGLFEARTAADVVDASNPHESKIDYHSRQRLLSKIANNSTTRSNIFFIWASVQFHDAHQPDVTNFPTAVQIGAKAEDIPGRRMFCVVDMSRLEEAFDPMTGTFDFRKFIIHRQLLP